MGLFERKKMQKEPLNFSEQWEFYQCYSNNQPFSIRFDTAIERLTENDRKQYPHIIELSIPFIESKENGFPTRSEMERINHIEDGFFSGGYKVRLVGAITGGNCARFVFCCDGTEKDVENIIKTLMNANNNNKFSKRVFINDNFQYYDDMIAPSAYEKNWIMNRYVCANLEKNGEAFSTPRKIDFRCCFSSIQYIQDVANKLREHGFAEGNEGKNENGEYWLDFTLEGIPSYNWINGVTNRIIDILDGTDGYLDGWGCTIVKDEEV